MEKIQVYIISPQFIIREGTKQAISTVEQIQIAGLSDINDEVLKSIESAPPDVAIIDIDGLSDGGLKLARTIKQISPSVGVIILSSNQDDRQVFEALKAQASAFIGKNASAEVIVDTVKRVATGEHPINESVMARPRVAEDVLQQFGALSNGSGTRQFFAPLTPREKEILDYIARGFLNKQIAIKFGISEQTIKNHVTSILRKLNVNVRTEAVVVAIKEGLISL